MTKQKTPVIQPRRALHHRKAPGPFLAYRYLTTHPLPAACQVANNGPDWGMERSAAGVTTGPRNPIETAMDYEKLIAGRRAGERKRPGCGVASGTGTVSGEEGSSSAVAATCGKIVRRGEELPARAVCFTIPVSRSHVGNQGRLLGVNPTFQ